MPRPKNTIETVQLRVSLTGQLLGDVELLLETGRFGANVNEAINRLIGVGVQTAFSEGENVLHGRQAIEKLAGRKPNRRK